MKRPESILSSHYNSGVLTSKFFGGDSGSDSDSSSDSESPQQKISDRRYKEDFEEIQCLGKTYAVLCAMLFLFFIVFLFLKYSWLFFLYRPCYIWKSNEM